MKIKFFLPLILFLISITSYASVYMQTDNTNNDVTYSDTPVDNSQKIDPNTYNSNPAIVPSPSTPSASTGTKEKKAYVSVVISSPADQETIQNQPTIPVIVKTDPELQQGDRIQLYLDSNPIGDPQPSSNLMLPFVERGSHTLSAAVIDKSDKMLKQSDIITIFVHRANLNNRPAS